MARRAGFLFMALSLTAVCAVTGMGGVGKTAVALRCAQSVLDAFPDGQLYVNLRGFDPGADPLDPADAVRGFLDALAVAPRALAGMEQVA